MQILGLINELIGLPELASEHGSMVDHMLEMVHWLITVLLIGWSAFFIFCLWRFRQKRNPRASYAGVKGHASTHATGQRHNHILGWRPLPILGLCTLLPFRSIAFPTEVPGSSGLFSAFFIVVGFSIDAHLPMFACPDRLDFGVLLGFARVLLVVSA